MWRQALFVEFAKFAHFLNALEDAFVPVDCIEEAKDLWGDWTAREFCEHAAHDQYRRAIV